MEQSSPSKLFLLDTNVLLHEPLSIFSFQEHDVVIPMTVLEELDRIKDRQKDVSRDARVAIRALEDVFADATPEQILHGIELKNEADNQASGKVSIFQDHTLDKAAQNFTADEPDNRIINAALYLQKKHPQREVVLVTKDINMRLKAKGAGLEKVEDYRTDQLIDDIRLLAKGFSEMEGSFWGRVKDCESNTEGRDTIHTIDAEIVGQTYINQYIIDDTESFAGRVVGKHDDKIDLLDLGYERLMAKHAWGVHPKNVYQGMALDALLDPSIDLVILTGPAGCGKTGVNNAFPTINVQTIVRKASCKIRTESKFPLEAALGEAA